MSTSTSTSTSTSNDRSASAGGTEQPASCRAWESRRRRPQNCRGRRLVYSSEDGAIGLAAPDSEAVDRPLVDDDARPRTAAAEASAARATAGQVAAMPERVGVLWRRVLLSAGAYGDRLGRFFASVRGGGGGGGNGGGGVGPGVNRQPTEQSRIREEEALERRQRRAAGTSAAAVGMTTSSAGAFAFYSSFNDVRDPDGTVRNDDGSVLFTASQLAAAAQVAAPLPSVSSRVPMATVTPPIQL